MIEIDKFSGTYRVKRLCESDIPNIFMLCTANKMYYEYCPPMVTQESIRRDMVALPPNTKMENKYFVGYFMEEKLIAVLDVIDGYPKEGIAFIGFFMMDLMMQKKGVGSDIMTELCDYLKNENFETVRLAWAKKNSQAEHFWTKNGFTMLRETSSTACDCVILAEKHIGHHHPYDSHNETHRQIAR